MGSVGASKSTGIQSSEPQRNYFMSKSNVDEYTKDFTPEMFLGKDIENNYMNLAGLELAAEDNAPKELNIEGWTFQKMLGVHTGTDKIGRQQAKDAVVIDYQSTEQIGNEYPVLQVGIRVWRTRNGKVKSEIIRDGYTNKTKFW